MNNATDKLEADPSASVLSNDTFIDESSDNIMSTPSTFSDSESTISTSVDSSDSKGILAQDNLESQDASVTSSSINWESLISIENRMVCEDEDTTLFIERLHHVKDEDWEECHLPVQPIFELKHIITNSDHLPFNDIPNVPSINYDDSELKFWSALVAEYRQTALKLPKYASIMVRSGIPPALRGMVWKSLSEAATPTLGSLYDSLAAEWTPFVKIIGRDLNRTFPEIQMFREKGGEGQMKLGRVLRAYSAYDMQVGYCQGLTFLTGPLLLHMTDRDAFCVLVKLMEDYELRSMFTADMAGLPLRMYQFEFLFATQFPELYQHFSKLGVNNIYASQWFLSFFAVTCPLGMLVRIFDLSFAEGAIPTLLRVSLAVLKRNKNILMAFDEEEEILQHMLGRCLWDSYGLDADLLMTDVSSMSMCTDEKLRELEAEFKSGKKSLPPRIQPAVSKPMASFSTFPFGFKWSAGVVTPPRQTNLTKEDNSDSDTLSQLKSRMSVASSDFESSVNTERLKNYQTSATSFACNDSNTARATATAENQALRDQIAAFTAEIETLKFELQSRDRIEHEDENNTITSASQVNACCENLRMELALAKTNEVLARQEIEQLKHSLHTITEQPSTTSAVSVPVNTNTATNAATTTPSNSDVAAPKGWSIW